MEPEVIAAGVVAYRATSPVYLTPFPDTLPTLLKLRDAGYKLGVASKGRAVKQWQKLIQLGLEHIFHAVTVSEETGSEALTAETLERTLEKLHSRPDRTMFVGSDLSREVAVVNKIKMITVRMKTGTNRTSSPQASDEKPVYEVARLSDLFGILQRT